MIIVEASAPGMPEVSNVTETTCTVVWSVPESNGGAEIEGYVLERKERKSTRWMKCSKKLIHDLRYGRACLSYFFFVTPLPLISIFYRFDIQCQVYSVIVVYYDIQHNFNMILVL